MAKSIVSPAAYERNEDLDESDLPDRRDIRLAQLKAMTGMLMCVDVDNAFVLDNLRAGYASLLRELIDEVQALTHAIEERPDTAPVQPNAAAKAGKPNGHDGIKAH